MMPELCRAYADLRWFSLACPETAYQRVPKKNVENRARPFVSIRVYVCLTRPKKRRFLHPEKPDDTEFLRGRLLFLWYVRAMVIGAFSPPLLWRFYGIIVGGSRGGQDETLVPFLEVNPGMMPGLCRNYAGAYAGLRRLEMVFSCVPRDGLSKGSKDDTEFLRGRLLFVAFFMACRGARGDAAGARPGLVWGSFGVLAFFFLSEILQIIICKFLQIKYGVLDCALAPSPRRPRGQASIY